MAGYLAAHPNFILGLMITVGTTCVLSILGASLIILTYAAYKDLRTIARQLLVNLSVADILVAATHFVGIFIFKKFFHPDDPDYQNNTDTLCSIQGALLMIGTIASFLWTISLAVYMFSIIILRRPLLARKMVVLFYVICWGIPLILTIWFGIKKFYGFEESVDVGKHNVSKAVPYGNDEQQYASLCGMNGVRTDAKSPLCFTRPSSNLYPMVEMFNCGPKNPSAKSHLVHILQNDS